MLIATDSWSPKLRDRGIKREEQLVLVTNLRGSDQETDLTEPPNCNGLGRLRHFKRKPKTLWENPLPIDPASKALGLGSDDQIVAQVFQNAVCNWRCWYCYVDFKLLSGDQRYSEWVTTDELVSLYSKTEPRAKIIDLSGGQPDLTPEWIPWMMSSLENAGYSGTTYLWSDDNLSNDYFWRYLTPEQIRKVASYANYGRAACFKGIDHESFEFNTAAEASGFDVQFDVFKRLLELGIDLYAYVTFTTPSEKILRQRVRDFVDRLQELHPNLPLRTVPLQIAAFKPVQGRLNPEREKSMKLQEEAIQYWREALLSRYSTEELSQRVVEVSLKL